MLIPMRGVDDSPSPWTFDMAFAEQAQLATKVASLLAPAGAPLGALSVDVAQKVVMVSVLVNGTQQPPISVPAWKPAAPFLTAFPADYIVDRVLGYLNIPTAP